MRVASQVGQDLFRSAEGPFGVHHPLAFAEGSQVLSEGLRILQGLQGGKEAEPSRVEGNLQLFEE